MKMDRATWASIVIIVWMLRQSNWRNWWHCSIGTRLQSRRQVVICKYRLAWVARVNKLCSVHGYRSVIDNSHETSLCSSTRRAIRTPAANLVQHRHRLRPSPCQILFMTALKGQEYRPFGVLSPCRLL